MVALRAKVFQRVVVYVRRVVRVGVVAVVVARERVALVVEQRGCQHSAKLVAYEFAQVDTLRRAEHRVRDIHVLL